MAHLQLELYIVLPQEPNTRIFYGWTASEMDEALWADSEKTDQEIDIVEGKHIEA